MCLNHRYINQLDSLLNVIQSYKSDEVWQSFTKRETFPDYAMNYVLRTKRKHLCYQ